MDVVVVVDVVDIDTMLQVIKEFVEFDAEGDIECDAGLNNLTPEDMTFMLDDNVGMNL